MKARFSAVVVFAALTIPHALGETQNQTSPTPTTEKKATAEPKIKKVWTEEDLETIPGRISVVGEPGAGETGEPPLPESRLGTAASRSGPGKECKSWAWATSVDLILRAQGVRLGRTFLMQKTFGGEVCLAYMRTARELVPAIEGDYTLSDGKRIRINARYMERDLFPIAAMVAAAKEGLPFIVIWNGQPYLTQDLEYTVLRNGSPYRIRYLKLFDPYLQRRATISHDKPADLAGIEATVEITVNSRK
jgi:hypothetical protein